MLGLHDALGFGGVAVLMDAWTRYGLDNVLAGVEGKLERGRIMAMVFSRHLFPGSKLSLKTSSADSALAAACGLEQDDLDEDRLYEAMDALSGKWVRIEKSLFTGAYPEPPTLVLYDLTSSYFEGAKNKKLAAYGYSRDHRSDRMQVILASATWGWTASPSTWRYSRETGLTTPRCCPCWRPCAAGSASPRLSLHLTAA